MNTTNFSKCVLVLSLVSLGVLAGRVGVGEEPIQAAPAGFDKLRDDAAKGEIKRVEYDSVSTGGKRPVFVYTPPGYTADKKYPVLYLLHGAGDDESGWKDKGAANIILDNLYADKKIVPMIVVMPLGFASLAGATTPAPAAGDPPPARGRGRGRSAGFEPDLLKDLIKYVETHYSTMSGPENRALAGLSMGGGQAISIGLRNTDTFAWVGGFSSSLGGSNNVLDNAETLTKQLKLLWLSCGDQDNLLNANVAFHNQATEKKIPHVWYQESGKHEWPVWKNDLYLLASRLFQPSR